MPFDLDLTVKIAVPLVAAVLGKYAERWLTRRPKLISYLGHASAFTLRGTEAVINVHTHAIIVRNAGRTATHNVRIGHYVLPDNFQLSPAIPHTVEKKEGNIAEIIIPILVPGEQITISYLYFPPLLYNQIHAYTKSDEGYAKILNVIPTPQYPKWMSRCIWALVFMGAVSLIYLLVELIRKFI
jgi:hypothetical protein